MTATRTSIDTGGVQKGDRPKRKRYKPDIESRWLEFGKRLSTAIAMMAPHRGGRYTMADLARDLVPKLEETPQKHKAPDSSTISLWAQNVQRPSLETILLIAECLKPAGVDPGWLAFGSWANRGFWPTWAFTAWRETNGEVPGEREGRYRARTDARPRPSEPSGRQRGRPRRRGDQPKRLLLEQVDPLQVADL